MKRFAIVASTLLLAGGLSSAFAQSDTAPTAGQFVQQAGIAGLYEVEAGKLANEKGENAEVRSFGATMVKDHTAAGDELKATAGDMAVPTAVDSTHQAQLDTLKAASGPAFDRLYVDQQVEAHKEAVSLFTSFSTTGPNGALKGFAAKTLPMLQHHQEMVGRLKSGAG